MSFLKITDPKKRDLMVAEFLKTKKNIQRNQLVERLGEQHAMAGFTRQFKPITDVQKDISQNILSEIKNLPKAIDFPRAYQEYKEYTPAIEGDVPEMIGPIATNYMRKFASKDKDTDTVYGIYDNKGKFYIGDTSFIECCVHYCGLQIVHVSASFQLLSLFVRIVWSQSSL